MLFTNPYFVFTFGLFALLIKVLKQSSTHRCLSGLAVWVPDATQIDGLSDEQDSKGLKRRKHKSQKPSDRFPIVSTHLQGSFLKALDNEMFYSQFDGVVFLLILTIALGAFRECWECVRDNPSSPTFVFFALSVAITYGTHCCFSTTFAEGWCNDKVKVSAMAASIGGVLAFALLFVTPLSMLDIPIESSYAEFQTKMGETISKISKLDNFVFDVPILAYKVALLVTAMAISFVHAFSNIQYAKAHCYVVASLPSDIGGLIQFSYWSKLGSYFSLFLALISSILWLRPLVKDTIDITAEQFETLKVATLLTYIFVRLLMFRPHVQAFLHMAMITAANAIRAQPVTKAFAVELKNYFRYTYQYIPLFCVQYLSPLLVTLAALVIYKREVEMNVGMCNFLVGENAPYQKYQIQSMMGIGATFDMRTNPLVVPTLSFIMFWVTFNTFVQGCAGLLYWRKTIVF